MTAYATQQAVCAETLAIAFLVCYKNLAEVGGFFPKIDQICRALTVKNSL